MIDKIDSIATKVVKRIAIVLASAAAVYLVLWVLIMTMSIIARSFFDTSWMFIEEYTAYLHMVAACGGFAYATYEGRHIVVRVIISRVHGRARLIFECVTTALGIWLVVFLTLKMFVWVSAALKSGAQSLETFTPMWIPYLVVVIGLCSFILALLLNLFRAVVAVYRGKEEIGEAGEAIEE